MTLKVKILQTLRRLFIILIGLTMTWFSEKLLISTRCISGLMPNLIKKSWTVSNVCFLEKKDSVPTQPRPSYPFKNNTSAASPTYVALNSPKMSSVGGVGVGGSLPPGGVPPPPPPTPSYQQQRVGPLPALPDVLRPSEDQSQHSTFFQSRGDYT